MKNITAPIEEMIRGLSDTHDNIEKMRKKITQQGDEVNLKIDQHYDRASGPKADGTERKTETTST